MLIVGSVEWPESILFIVPKYKCHYGIVVIDLIVLGTYCIDSIEYVHDWGRVQNENNKAAL